jgi:erythromycin esterase-like protein
MNLTRGLLCFGFSNTNAWTQAMKIGGKSLRISLGMLAIPVVGMTILLWRSNHQNGPISLPTYRWSDTPFDSTGWATFRQSELGQHSFIPLATTPTQIADEQLALFGQWVGNAQFIGLGEVNHDSKENIELRNRLVQYLIQDKGVKGVVQETTNTDFLVWLKAYNQAKPPAGQVNLLPCNPLNYESIKQFAEQVSGPVVIVGRNDHLQRHDLLHKNTEPVGCLLHKNESGNYVSVGSVLFEGAVRANRNDTVQTITLPSASPVCAEHFLAKLGEPVFLLNTISARQSPFFERVLTDTVVTRSIDESYQSGKQEHATVFDKQYDILLFFRTSSTLTEMR